MAELNEIREGNERDADIPVAAAAGRPLTGEEELRLQQLLQLQCWNQRRRLSVEGTPTEAATADPAPVPARWELTRGLTLRPWQHSCVDAWLGAGKRGVVKVVTGAGKTVLALAIAERLQQTEDCDLRIAVIVPTLVLLSQWLEEFRQHSNLPPDAVGVIGGGSAGGFSDRTRILVCVLNSAAKKLAREVARAGVGSHLLLVVDECHRAGAVEMRRVFETSRRFSLGLSATPERDEDEASSSEDDEPPEEITGPLTFKDSVIGQALGSLICNLDYATAIRDGILPPFRILHYGLKLGPKERSRYERASSEITDLRKRLETGERKGLSLIRWCRSKAAASNPAAQRLLSLIAERKRMLYRMEERGAAVNRILSDFFANQPDGKAILFHESIDEVMSLFTMLQQAGFSVVAEHSQFSDAMRTESLRLFRNGTARVIVSARSLIEGFNVPSADIGIVVAASASVRQRIQTLGRLLRRSVRADGTQKEATLHVLYAADTVDELIYEKADWEHFTGAKVNEYYAWTGAGTSEPEPRAEPPRRPRPIDAAIDISKLNPGDVYPGDPDQGKIFTIDTQGTMRAETGELLLPHDQLQAILGSYYRTTGRFRITPIKHLVLKLEKTREGWRSIYLGKLDDSPVAVGDNAATDMREYSAGDLYPLSKVKGRTFSVLQRDKRLIARKTASGVQFVVPFDAILDEPKTKRLREIQERLAAAYLRGHRMSKITVTAEGHVVYVVNNEGHFVGTAPEGSDGFEFESPSANKEEHR